MTRHPRTRRLRWMRCGAALLGVAALAAGCTGTSGGKSGAGSGPVTLVLANNDHDDLDGAPAVQYFADRLEELSGGSVVVEVRSRWKGGADEAQVLRDVAAGEADLGWAGTRALDRLGIADLTPLHAPFLVDTYAAQAAVLADDEVRGRLDALEAEGMVGLALLADELRFPVGVRGPLLSPQDYQGKRLRTVASDVQSESLAALGASPTSEGFEPTMDGAELSWWTYLVNRFHEHARFPTVNTPLWPRSVVLVADPAALDGLDDQTRGWVTAAAQDAAEWSFEHARDREADQVLAACEAGARLSTATPEQAAALEAAAEPVHERLRGDPQTAELLTRIEQLVAGAPAEDALAVPAGCAFSPGDEAMAPEAPVKLTAPGDPGDLPEGVYRYELTEQVLREAGVPANDIEINAGVFTWTLQGGTWQYEHQPVFDDVPNLTCEGFYDVSGTGVAMSVSTATSAGECAPALWTASWTMAGDVLTWSDVDIPDFAAVWSVVPWRKIG